MHPSTRTLVTAGILVAAGALLLGYMATHPAPVAHAPSSTATSTPTARAELATTTLERGTYYEIAASYPIKTSLSVSASTRAGDAALALMKKWNQDTVAEFKKNGNFDHLTHDDIQMMGLAERKETLEIKYLTASAPGTVSYVFTIYMDTLGAHPNGFYNTFTFDSATGQSLALKDLFTPGAPYLLRLSSIARAKLPAIIGQYADADYIKTGTVPKEENFSSFYIDNGKLVLLFPPYQVGPYSIGSQTLPIPLADLTDILKSQYQ